MSGALQFFYGGARSSVVEHLPFKQRVGGSRPPGLTKDMRNKVLCTSLDLKSRKKENPEKSGQGGMFYKDANFCSF